jgi:hypothetical protein
MIKIAENKSDSPVSMKSKPPNKPLFLLLLLVAMASVPAVAQAQAVDDYLASAGNGALIYSGRKEAVYPYVKGHPYADTDRYREGWLVCEGRMYPQQMMRLDAHADELIVLSADRRFGIVVSPGRVDSVMLPPYTYVYVKAQPAKQALPQGYYAKLYDGAAWKVVKRETKSRDKVANGKVMEEHFISRTRYYIGKDGLYRAASGRSAALKCFPDRKKELQAYIRLQGLDFKNRPDEAYASLTAYYETLNP